MSHPSLRPSAKLRSGLLALSIVAIAACGSSAEDSSDPAPPSSTGASNERPGMPATNTPSAGPSAEEIAAATEAIGMAAGQVQAACGDALDACRATDGCNEILTCAARNACSGRDCYCLGADCATDGPCRSVIDSAPGARVPDASDQSLGPASEAARGVGACLQGLGGGGGSSPAPTTEAPAASGSADAGSDAS